MSYLFAHLLNPQVSVYNGLKYLFDCRNRQDAKSFNVAFGLNSFVDLGAKVC